MYGILYGTEAMNGGSVSVSSRLQITSMYKSVKRGKRLKNHTDVLIFQLRVCAGATNSKLQSQI